MPNHLLAIAIGPVQDFIAAARRTRDLWYGSKLLSDVSKAVAKQLKEEGAELIFPSAENLNRDSGNSDISIANQVVALVKNTETDKIQTLVKAAKEATHKYWRREAEKALALVDKENGSDLIDQKIWSHQLNDVLELHAAWVLLESDGKYAEQHTRLMVLLHARKNTRDFRPGQGFAGVRKSLLDGARESVLPEPDPEKELSENQIKACRNLGIKITPAHYCEPLDAVGVIKRVCGSKMSYPSVSRIAIDPWLRKLEELKAQGGLPKDALAELRNSAEKIPKRLVANINERYSRYQNFPFDGTLLYLDRHPSILTEGGEKNSEPLENFRKQLQRLLKDIADNGPNSYLAIISADGDRMGEVLRSHTTLETHRAISRQLSEFSNKARQCIEEHFGVCIYAGGDDVLALVPLDKCLKAAGALREHFSRYLSAFDVQGNAPTLSVGIAVGHFMESLHDLRELAKEAERCAKDNGRNRLAVIFQPRGGNRYVWHESWRASPSQCLQDWIDAFSSRLLANTLPYDLERLIDVYKHFQEPLVKDALRLLEAKNVGHTEMLSRTNCCSSKETMRQLVNELLLASRLASLLPRKGMPNETA